MIKYLSLLAFATALSLAALAALGIPSVLSASADSQSGTSIDAWWPTDGAHVSGVQPFKAMIPGLDIAQYQMYWSVDGGTLVPMDDSQTDSPHKEASVDVSGWDWHGEGPYVVTFTAQQGGTTIGEHSVAIYLDGVAASASSSAPAVAASSSAPTAGLPAGPLPQTAPSGIAVWWPTSGTALQGVQPFKATLTGESLDQYQMFWQVGSGTLVPMDDSQTDSPHKEASVDVSGWNWQPGGNYQITFVAQDHSGNTLARQSETVFVTPHAGVAAGGASVSVPSVQKTLSALATSSAASSSAPTQSAAAAPASKFYVNPASEAAEQAANWQGSDPSAATAMKTLADEPTASWFGDWDSNIQSDVHTLVSSAAAAQATPVLVAYDIPERDCGSYSSGGASAPSAYQSWIGSFAAGIGTDPAVVILEPDALAEISCLSSQDEQARLSLLSGAVATLKHNPATKVYIDAGHADWIDPAAMAALLTQAGITEADGFSLNVSNFDATQNEIQYGTELSGLLGGKHFVIDTSRNGLGSDGLWCNPPGRAVGSDPTTNTGNPLVDAFLWIKTPGESDGSCNGGPSAGAWWPEYALDLIQNAR